VERSLSVDQGPGDRTEAGAFLRVVEDRVKNSEEVEKARKKLVGMGISSAAIATWSPLRVIVLDEYMHYESLRDEQSKWMTLPYYQARVGLQAVHLQIKNEAKHSPMLNLLPAVEKVKRAQTRLEQRVAYLRIIEAIRLHALTNGGNLPEKLSEIKLPIPNDPVSGRSFEYELKKGVAVLHGENPLEAPESNRYYMIILAK
jgi:hypothetical protein